MRSLTFDRREFLKTAGVTAVAVTHMIPRLAHAARRPMSDVIVLLPGITGSVLQKQGRDVWALSPSGLVRALRTLGQSLDSLRLKDDQTDVEDLGDGVTANRIFSDVHLIPGLWKIDGYTKVARHIESEFTVERGKNFFEFPYDWRRDNRVAARRLARQSHDWLAAWRKTSGNSQAKLILVGHSMGGLVSRYFLECLEGWRSTRMLVTFGTPYRGSLNAVGFLANGMQKNLSGIGLDLTELLRSFTSVYQLLPIYPCYDTGNGKLVRIAETDGIPNIERSRAEAALAFHREIQDAVDIHLKDETYRNAGYTIHPIVGTYQPTGQVAKLVGDKLTLSTVYPGHEYLDGDGTVPEKSASPIELDDKHAGMFVAGVHGSLQNADPVLVHLTRLLGEQPIDGFKGALPDLSLRVGDGYPTGEPIRFTAKCEDPTRQLSATIVDTRNNGMVARPSLERDTEGGYEAESPPLPEGTYRVIVTARSTAASVSDVFVVL